MKEWMKRLAEKHRLMRETYPSDNLIVVFDIDDTILDLRHMIIHVLRSFDKRHGTRHFQSVSLDDIQTSERRIEQIAEWFGVCRSETPRIIDWFKHYSWSSSVMREAHHPFPGVMEVIRWLQNQPTTSVGLNTGRPECVRRETLQCLHDLGRPHGVAFEDILLFMNPYGWGDRIIESKVEGIRYFQDLQYRVVAFIDNEPENLQAVAEHDRSGDILLLHADTVFDGNRVNMPIGAFSGRIYDADELTRTRDEWGRAA